MGRLVNIIVQHHHAKFSGVDKLLALVIGQLLMARHANLIVQGSRAMCARRTGTLLVQASPPTPHFTFEGLAAMKCIRTRDLESLAPDGCCGAKLHCALPLDFKE